MKIIKLTASNVKRLRAVEITPDGTLQVVTGRNGQGKTSVLDAIWLALGGGAAARETLRPIRDGEDRASVTLDLGDLIVTRTWSGSKTALTVTNADGARYSSPQSMLDSLVGRLSFDPLAFTRLSAKAQRDALLELVDLGIDLDENARQRQALYDRRTELGRQGKSMGDVPATDDTLPSIEQSASDLIAQIRAAENLRRDGESARAQAAALVSDRSRIAEQIAELEARRDALDRRIESAAQAVRNLPAVPDVSEMESQLAGVESLNAAIRANEQAKRAAARKDGLRAEYEDASAKIAALDKAKADALANAQLPVDGLGFDDSGVTFNGVPFSQASSAEQIRVSLAMAMALNPELRVVRIIDGSLLDADSMQQVAAMAAAADYQVWVERVSDESAAAVVIEDGTVLA